MMTPERMKFYEGWEALKDFEIHISEPETDSSYQDFEARIQALEQELEALRSTRS